MKSVAVVLAVLFSGGFVAPGPETVCTISDGRLAELSGLAATADGYVTVNDGADDPDARRIFFLSADCSVSREVSYPSEPRDTEDLAVAPDGTVWTGDIGDNGSVRSSIGLWRLAPGASRPELHRFTYPDGPRDAEALLLDGDGTPIIISKDPIRAGVYAAAASASASASGDVLRKAGSFRIPDTSTSNPFGFAGRLVITGGAVSPDGTRVVLRTYADAFEFPVVDGDIIKAITEGTAERIPLPDEPQGESITYSPDGKSLLTVSEGESPSILRYPSAVPAPSPSSLSSPSAAPSADVLAEPVPSRGALTPAGIAVAAGAGVLVLAALGFGLTRRLRHR